MTRISTRPARRRRGTPTVEPLERRALLALFVGLDDRPAGPDAVVSPAGRPLDGNADGFAGDDFVLSFRDRRRAGTIF